MKIDIKKVFGENLRKLREERNLTQADLAEKAGMDRSYISELERGILMPSLETVFKVLKPFEGIRAGQFIEEVEKKIAEIAKENLREAARRRKK